MTSAATALRTDVSVLYVDPRGPYPKLVADWWDEARDARNYYGPGPIVAHPPCGPWSRFRVLRECNQDRGLALRAVEQVRELGGILEHPAGSLAFEQMMLPHPGEFPDSAGGETYEVDQVSWGHACSKPTWLYCVGLPRVVVLRAIVAAQAYTGSVVATHVLSRDRRRSFRDPRPEASHEIRRRTPIAFAEWLLDLAAQARQSK